MSLPALWSYEITLAPATQSASTARRFVHGHLVAQGLPLLVDDIVLVASELATNAIEHARSEFTLSLSATAKTVTVVVKDSSAVLPTLVDAEGLDVAGRGVAIVDSLSREWGVFPEATQGKAVWAAFDVGEP